MDIQLSQIIFQIINFSIVIGALTFWLNKPVQKVLKERAEKIKKGQQAAEKAMEDRQLAAKAKEKALDQARNEADQMLNQAQQAAYQEKKKLMTQAEDELAEMKKKKVASWEKEKQAMTDKLRVEMINSVCEISKKVIDKSLSPKDHQQLIDQELDILLKKI
ncbi:MAG: hypothetical protein GF381_04275 [Candidatus Pacebacteria bacterium]|nr:hypothetical protein [Candidatus Paceibacterota bacterium]